MSSTADGSTFTTSPTRPMSTSSPPTSAVRFSAVNSPASSPDSPTAYGPCWLISPTSSRPTCPTSTIPTTSMFSGVVTRSPPRNSPGRPSRFSIALICGPPPCTTTGWIPASRRNTMSRANACLSCSSIIALPPYFTTTTRSCHCCSQGSASASTAAFSPAPASRSAAVVPGAAGSGGVGTVLLHVGVRQVGGQDLRGAAAQAELDVHQDLLARQVRRGAVAGGDAAVAEQRAVDRDVEQLGVDVGVAVADGRGHPAPVRVGAEQRGLDQAVAGDGAGHGHRVVLARRPAHPHGDPLGDALGVGLHLLG